VTARSLLVGVSSFSEGGRRAAKGIIHASDHRGVAPGRAGPQLRQIGQSVNLSPSTIQGYVTRAQRAGLSWPLPEDLDGLALEERLFSAAKKNSDLDVRNLIG